MPSDRWVAQVIVGGKPRTYAFCHEGTREEAAVWFGLAHRGVEAFSLVTVEEWFAAEVRRTEFIRQITDAA